ncbi:MAG: penicillin-binding transpeptidase domain-containing protein, partial [Actinomycetota bacterium]
SGIMAARGGGYKAPAGGAVVMRPNGEIVGLASYPSYNPAKLADGITLKEWNALGHKTPNDHDDDALLDRAIQSATPPGSTFKAVTAGAAMAHGVASPYTFLPCPGSITRGGTTFPNWTSANFGSIGFARSLEISCDTFYYELGWRLEQRYGPYGDETERFQDYMRLTGFGHDTGIDLPYEQDGLVPDQEWCEYMYDQTRTERHPTCEQGWLPGYTVNMAIGQGDLLVTPLQMAVAYAAVANGGKVVEPRVAMEFRRTDEKGDAKVVRKVEPKVRARLPLDETELGVIRQGLVDVVSSGGGTAAPAFAGFPMGSFPVAGKTGTAQIGSADSGLNYAWFTSYAPATHPRYVVAVYLEKAGHGGESAAPVARQILEGIFNIDKKAAEVHLGEDDSG